jgi:hypothetical protein
MKTKNVMAGYQCTDPTTDGQWRRGKIISLPLYGNCVLRLLAKKKNS